MQIIVDENDIRLDKYLARNTEYSRSLITKMLENDYILVNGIKVKNSYLIQENDVIDIKEGFIKETKVEANKMDIDVVYEDNDILIINKPSGLVVHPGNGNFDNTLVNGLMYYSKELSDGYEEYRPGIVHRIDKDTSGLLIIAKNNKSQEILSDMFKNHTIEREYIALVNGGSFRTPFYRGNITNATIHSFDPFGNDLVKFKAYGRDIIRIFQQLQGGDKGFYPFSGLKMVVRMKPSRKLLSIKLWDGYKEEEIDEDKLYSIASSDFCFPLESDEVGGDDFQKIYQWFRPIDGQYLNINGTSISRDILINYLRNIDELKASKYYDENNLRLRVINTE